MKIIQCVVIVNMFVTILQEKNDFDIEEIIVKVHLFLSFLSSRKYFVWVSIFKSNLPDHTAG